MTTYRMPAEWEPHERTWLAWPHHEEDWPEKYAAVPWVYLEIVRHVHRFEPVSILVKDEHVEARAREVLGKQALDHSRIDLVRVPTDRSWIRDYGPIFVRDAEGNIVGLDWRFNGWAKYDNWRADDAVPARLAERGGWPRIEPVCGGERVVLEGGSIEVNGQGMMLTTEECLLSPVQARNPELSREDLEAVFGEYLGVEQVIWLGRGIAGDDTHGHVDDLARFVTPRTVVTAVEMNPDDVNYQPLQENLERLKDIEGLEVVPLPMPEPVVFEGERLPASYANFYLANGCALVPTFNCSRDRVALGILAELLPDREIIPIHAVDLVWGLGTLHCLSQQQPRPHSP